MTAKRKITAEARPVGEVLRSQYAVPANQRDFAWRAEEQVDALWTDLTDAMSEGRDEYFLGAIVVRDDTDAFEIVDGQQRMTALSMIFSAIARAWGDDDRGKEVKETYLGSKDRRSRDVIPKLALNEINDAVFQAVVLNDAAPTDADMRNKSNQLLQQGYRRIVSRLDAWVAAQSDREEALIDLEDFVSQATNLIVIEVGDESDAFVIFETLNDRGMDLAVSDLVKNYLFASAGGGAALLATKKNWSEISQAVGSENLTAFLRHYWMSAYEQLRERDLYRRLREVVKGGGKAKLLVATLQKAADHYAALGDPAHPYWADFPIATQRHVRLLKLLRTSQYRPLALAVMDGGDQKEVAAMMRLVWNISFRYVVSGLSANDLEKAYSDAALLVRKTEKRNFETLKTLLKSVTVGDADFQRSFEVFAFSKAEIARYALGEVNRALETDGAVAVDEDASLEHIMPRKPSNEWIDLPPPEDLSIWVERIGNLTVLEKAVNARLGSKGFDKKKAMGFEKSKLAVNSGVVASKTWTTAEIAERSGSFAKLAPGIWRIE